MGARGASSMVMLPLGARAPVLLLLAAGSAGSSSSSCGLDGCSCWGDDATGQRRDTRENALSLDAHNLLPTGTIHAWHVRAVSAQPALKLQVWRPAAAPPAARAAGSRDGLLEGLLASATGGKETRYYELICQNQVAVKGSPTAEEETFPIPEGSRCLTKSGDSLGCKCSCSRVASSSDATQRSCRAQTCRPARGL